jgi:hypothetical protein
MAGVWSLYCNWRTNGNRHFRNPQIFYLYLISYVWFAGYLLFDPRFLDERKKLHQKFKEKPFAIFIIYLFE